ncbi:MAG: hypothetical protein ACLFRL_07395, partial [Desulfohalobiaceae bacterium]
MRPALVLHWLSLFLAGLYGKLDLQQQIFYCSHALRGSFFDRSCGLFMDAGASRGVPTQSVGTIKEKNFLPLITQIHADKRVFISSICEDLRDQRLSSLSEAVRMLDFPGNSAGSSH